MELYFYQNYKMTIEDKLVDACTLLTNVLTIFNHNLECQCGKTDLLLTIIEFLKAANTE